MSPICARYALGNNERTFHQPMPMISLIYIITFKPGCALVNISVPTNIVIHQCLLGCSIEIYIASGCLQSYIMQFLNLYIYAYMRAWIYIYIYIYIYNYSHRYTHAHICTYICSYSLTNICICT